MTITKKLTVIIKLMLPVYLVPKWQIFAVLKFRETLYFFHLNIIQANLNKTAVTPDNIQLNYILI